MVLRNTKVGSGSTMRKKTTNALNGRETAACQRRTRQQHAQERAQDYVETIADLIASYGEARATDLAKSLGVSHVTVIPFLASYWHYSPPRADSVPGFSPGRN
jgi:hypothetical protein